MKSLFERHPDTYIVGARGEHIYLEELYQDIAARLRQPIPPDPLLEEIKRLRAAIVPLAGIRLEWLKSPQGRATPLTEDEVLAARAALVNSAVD